MSQRSSTWSTAEGYEFESRQGVGQRNRNTQNHAMLPAACAACLAVFPTSGDCHGIQHVLRAARPLTLLIAWGLCAQIIWRLAPNADMRKAAVQWSRYTWRRGSVPLWWSVKIKNNGMGEAEIKIQQSGTFKGSRRWGGAGRTGS